MPLQHQRENLKEYSLAENHLINKIIVSDSFNKQSSSYESWEIASFYPGNSENPAEVHGNWMQANFDASVNGLQLRSFILRTKPTICLKSIASEITLKFRLTGESIFWTITRGLNIKDSEAVICKIKKEKDSQRVFLIFGANIGRSDEFKFFKKQEFPEISTKGEEIVQDYVDMKIRFIDNGDDRVFVKALTGKDKHIEVSCDKYIPTLRNTPVMLAGSGESVLIKNCSVRQVHRVQGRPTMTRYECCRLF